MQKSIHDGDGSCQNLDEYSTVILTAFLPLFEQESGPSVLSSISRTKTGTKNELLFFVEAKIYECTSSVEFDGSFEHDLL